VGERERVEVVLSKFLAEELAYDVKQVTSLEQIATPNGESANTFHARIVASFSQESIERRAAGKSAADAEGIRRFMAGDFYVTVVLNDEKVLSMNIKDSSQNNFPIWRS
jgi:hypothetical protein